MIDSAIVYIRQEIFTNAGAALQNLNYHIYLAENLRKYFNVTTILKSFVEPPLSDTTPLTERKELAAALQYIAENPNVALLVSSLAHLSPRQDDRNEVLNLLLRKGFRLLCGQPLLDTRKLDDQQQLRRNLQKSLV